MTLSTASGGGNTFLEQAVGGLTLTNHNTIQGAGIIGNSGLTLINQGTINANSSGQTLILQSWRDLTNRGLMEATNGGFCRSTESRSTTPVATSPPTAAARCNW